jgi:Holliday junction resolvase RusA-like endonuclease
MEEWDEVDADNKPVRCRYCGMPVSMCDCKKSAETLSAEQPSAPPITIIVYGQPAPQGSKHGFVNKATGAAILVENSKKNKPWREAVKFAALEVGVPAGGFAPMQGPILARMIFTLARPKGHYRSGKNAHMLRDGAPARPCGHSGPDLSKLARSTEDALTDAGVWIDDGQVVEYARLAKVYAGEDPEALDVPGARIVVSYA